MNTQQIRRELIRHADSGKKGPMPIGKLRQDGSFRYAPGTRMRELQDRVRKLTGGTRP